MIFRFLFLLLIPFGSLQESNDDRYYKDFYMDGTLKEEGWKESEKKIGYWYFYHTNGKIASQGNFKNNKKDGYWYFYNAKSKKIKEGHFKKNNAENWWIIYDIADASTNKIVRKYQFRNNKKNGFCLLYKNNELFKAEKYMDDEKIGEWTSIQSFKRDNPNASL